MCEVCEVCELDGREVVLMEGGWVEVYIPLSE
jgi:hypothetical protein